MRWKLEHILNKEGGGILFEDDYLLAINKPANLLAVPDRFVREKLNLYDLLKETFGSIYIVHRIDKETSGVILFAKTPETHAFLNNAFEQRQVEKIYYAIISGNPKNSTGKIDLPISVDNYDLKKMKIDIVIGKESVTEYKTIEQFDGYALIEAKPLSGRTHQIRIHLSAIGLPILADPLYGIGNRFYLSEIKHNYRKRGEEKPLLERTALHAYSTKFIHPIMQKKIIVEAKIPKDFDAVLKALRKYKPRDNY